MEKKYIRSVVEQWERGDKVGEKSSKNLRKGDKTKKREKRWEKSQNFGNNKI